VGHWFLWMLRGRGADGTAGAGSALVALVEAWLAQGVAETEGSNAGPDVSWLIHDGGGSPDKRPPWCAYFVSSCCRQVERTGDAVRYATTGRAVAHWQEAAPADQIMPLDIWRQDPRGLLMVRTRLSKDHTDAQKARDGMARQGHVGVVTAINEAERTIDLIAGNSSGAGHSEVAGSGSVARERIVEGDQAWARLVGFVRVCDA
jgi:hypothetical protein